MSTTIYYDEAKLKERLETLRAQCEAAQKEMEEIGLFLVLGRKYSVPAQPQHITSVGALQAVGNSIIKAQGQTKHARIIKAAEEVLSDGKRRLSRELIKEIRDRGVEVGGADPTKEAAALSSYLSKEKAIFESDVKAGGWTLVRHPKKAKSEDAPTSSDFFHNGLNAHQPQAAR